MRELSCGSSILSMGIENLPLSGIEKLPPVLILIHLGTSY